MQLMSCSDQASWKIQSPASRYRLLQMQYWLDVLLAVIKLLVGTLLVLVGTIASKYVRVKANTILS